MSSDPPAASAITPDLSLPPNDDDVLPWLKRLSALYASGCDESREHMTLIVAAAVKEIEQLRADVQSSRDLQGQLTAERNQHIETLKRLALLSSDRAAQPTICLSGSSRFIDIMAVVAWELEKRGHVTLHCNLLPGWYTQTPHHLAEEQGVAERLDAVHLSKIDIADELLVIDVDGYIGDSTRREIGYATGRGKPVRYLSADPSQADRGQYRDLLYAVGKKHTGESRHETALRYIRQAEQSHGPASDV